MTAAALALATRLSIVPWKGAGPKTAIAGATTFRLRVSGAAGAHVHVRASGQARGWIAAFCTDKVCSPDETDLVLPASGRVDVSFELVRDDERAPRESGTVTVETGDGGKVTASAP